MKKLILSIALLSLVACASSNPQKIADKRAEIDAMAAATLTFDAGETRKFIQPRQYRMYLTSVE